MYDDYLIVSYAYADIITISAVGGCTIVFNTILAITISKEAYSIIDIISVILITSGASVCVIFSSYAETEYSTEVSYVLTLSIFLDKPTINILLN